MATPKEYFPINNVRAAAILTNSYVASSVIDTGIDYNQMDILIKFTKGSLTSLEIYVERSIDGTNFYPETNQTVSGGAVTLNPATFGTTTDGNQAIELPIHARYYKISAKGTGTVAGSSLALDVILKYV